MRWKADLYLNPDANGKQKETFGFNSRNTPPQVSAMLNFEKRLLNMIENIKFKKVKCWFQQKLSSDIELEAKDITRRLDLDDQVNTTAKREDFITLKDHKPNFANLPPY